MDAYEIFIIFFLIIIVFIVCYFYYKNFKCKYYDLTYISGTLEKYDDYEKNEINPKQIVKFTNNYVNLDKNDALVIYGEIPKNYPYFSITGYIYDVPSVEDPKIKNLILGSIGDSYSSANYYSKFTGNLICVIMTQNINLFEKIRDRIKSEFHKKNIKILFCEITKDFIIPQATYTIIVDTVLINKKQKLPEFKCRLYNSMDIDYQEPTDELVLKNRNSVFNEKMIIDDNDFYDSAVKVLYKEGYKISKNINTHSYLNIDSGKDCIDGGYIFCRINNRDITYIVSEEIIYDENYEIVIISVDHSMASMALISIINVIDVNERKVIKSFVNGSLGNKNINRNKIVINLNSLKEFNKKIRIEEKIYINPETFVGPDYNSIHFMKIFLCHKKK